MSQLTNETPPVACTLGSTELRGQVGRWRELYARSGTDRTETDYGLRVAFRRDPSVERELRSRGRRDRVLRVGRLEGQGRRAGAHPGDQLERTRHSCHPQLFPRRGALP